MSPAPENETDVPAPARDPNGYADANLPAADSGNAQNEALDVGSMIRAALVNGSDLSGPADAQSLHAYDGHVSLALDTEILPAIDATLDLLTTATDLFDVPAFDFGHSAGNVGDA